MPWAINRHPFKFVSSLVFRLDSISNRLRFLNPFLEADSGSRFLKIIIKNRFSAPTVGPDYLRFLDLANVIRKRTSGTKFLNWVELS